LARLRPFY